MDTLASRIQNSPSTFWSILVIIVILAGLLVLLAPAEATIGQGIRIVYIHVALIWSGMLILLVAGLLGLIILLSGRDRLAGWMQAIAWTGLVIFASGVITSLAAEIVNWGGIAWREPRTAANLNLLAIAIITQVINSWLAKPRLNGGLNFLLAAAIVWTTLSTEVQLHPDNAVGDATSSTIQFAFYGLTILCLIAAATVILYVRGRQIAAQNQEPVLAGNVGNDRSGLSSNEGN